MENINLKIHNYKLSEKQTKELENKMDFLLKQIPCNSRVLLDFDYKDKVFYGKLKVDCGGKSFFSTDQDERLLSLTSSLCKKIQKQAMKWKKSRTIEEITGIIALEPYLAKKGPGFHSYKKAG